MLASSSSANNTTAQDQTAGFTIESILTRPPRTISINNKVKIMPTFNLINHIFYICKCSNVGDTGATGRISNLWSASSYTEKRTVRGDVQMIQKKEAVWSSSCKKVSVTLNHGLLS